MSHSTSQHRASLHIDSVPAELRRLSHWLSEEAKQARLAPEAAYALELCANEAVTNILVHGRPAEERILLEFAADDAEFSLRIEDCAPPFDPLGGELPGLPSSLDDATPGGLGLVLIRRLMPASRYIREGDRNVLVLRGSPLGSGSG